ncbi:hypothetical protein [Cellulomonas sp. URHE0023]|uniref:hypothetical protein n=1 Tax=Cellulomonas sp. URHE0023 TaxID=1380354 RepID=UPI000489CAE5|nr:hypothetical protein [Cellulomonas sp. URHE0023]
MEESGGALVKTGRSEWARDARTVGWWSLAGLLLPATLSAVLLAPSSVLTDPEALPRVVVMLLAFTVIIGVPAALVGAVLGLVAVMIARRLRSPDDPRRRLAVVRTCWSPAGASEPCTLLCCSGPRRASDAF